MKGQVRTTPPTFLEGELAIPSLTADGKIQVDASVSIAGGATEAKQDSQIALETDIKTAVESIDTKTPTTPFGIPRIWKKYASIPPGGIDLTAEFPGRTPCRIETYSDGLLNVEPLDTPGDSVSHDTYYGWTWTMCAGKILDTTTAVPIIAYWL